jgi:hypothetical protein
MLASLAWLLGSAQRNHANSLEIKYHEELVGCDGETKSAATHIKVELRGALNRTMFCSEAVHVSKPQVSPHLLQV